jgi:hypothetical protein
VSPVGAGSFWDPFGGGRRGNRVTNGIQVGEVGTANSGCGGGGSITYIAVISVAGAAGGSGIVIVEEFY